MARSSSSRDDTRSIGPRLTPAGWSDERDAALAATQARLFGRGLLPYRLGRYVVLERAGSGGMGVVWAAYDPELDRRVAIKLVGARGSGRDRTAERARLLREAQAAAKLAHPNVVTVHDIGTYDPGDDERALGVFVVMELIPGRTLAAWLQERLRPWREILEMFMGAGRGLAAAHAAGLVHRDFKPHNVMIGGDGRARVLDFGLAVVDTRSSSHHDDEPATPPTEITATGTTVGTPLYMAPEQHERGEIDARADQFAFCVALFEALHRVRPYSGNDVRELATAKRAQSITPPEHGHALPARLERAIRRGLAADPDRRFVSMDALLAELSRVLGGVRRWPTIALAAGSAIAAALAVGSGSTVHCDGATTAIAEVWNEGSRAAIDASFSGTGHADAVAQALAAKQGLDAYAAAWTEARVETCRSVAGADESTRPVFVRRGDCLDARLRALDETAGFLAAADRATVGSATRVVAVLPPVASCLDDVRATSSRVGSIAEEGDVERLSVRLRAQRLLDRFDEAVKTGEEMVAFAREINHRPTEARGLVAMAWAHEGARRFDRAEPPLRQAWAIAEGDGLHADSMRAALDLAGVVVEQGRCREALDLLAIAEAKAAYVGATSDGLRADMDFVRGRALACAGQLDEAKVVLETTMLLRQTVFGPDHVAVAWVADVLADVEERRGAGATASPLRDEARRIRRLAGVCVDERCDPRH